MKRTGLLLIAAFLFSFSPEQLPNVLIIGDSISIGYTPFVVEDLQKEARVVHNSGNAGDTGIGLENINEWLGNTEWDIIHFNWGLWDLCYRSPQSEVYGNRDKINGTVTFTPEEYGENLEKLVVLLKKTGAKLIFATTTTVPPGEAGRFVEDDNRYNKVALKIMKKYDVQVNRLNSISKQIHKEHAKAKDDVHYTEKGYKLLAKPVIKAIRKNL